MLTIMYRSECDPEVCRAGTMIHRGGIEVTTTGLEAGGNGGKGEA